MQPAFRTPEGAVRQDACDFCFRDKFSEDGLLLCMLCDCCACPEHATLHHAKTGHSFFLRKRYTPKALPESDKIDLPPEAAKSALDAALTASALREEDNYTLCTDVMHIERGSLAPEEIETDAGLSLSAALLGVAQDSRYVETLHDWTTDNSLASVRCPHFNAIVERRRTNPNEKLTTVDRAAAACVECGINENLWICLDCGAVGCGRAQYGVVGAGHAKRHAEHCGHSVALKLGTISASGAPEIYCYACDSDISVEKPTALAPLLAPFGLSLSGAATEKLTSEIEVEQSMALSLTSALEGGENLPTIRGPGFRGIRNVGSACYASAAAQAVFAALCAAGARPSCEDALRHFRECINEPQNCLTCQEYRLFLALTAPSSVEPDHILPHGREFIPLACPSFSAERGRQQDSAEFLMHWLTRSRLFGGTGTSKRECRCSTCGGCTFQRQAMERILQVPLEGCSNGVALGELTAALFAETSIPGRACSFCGCRSGTDGCAVVSRESIVDPPHFLVVQPLRASFGPGFVPIKLETKIDVPEVLDLSHCLARSSEPGNADAWRAREETAAAERAAQLARVPEESVAMLLSFGIADADGCRRALAACGGNLELAADMLMSGTLPPEPERRTSSPDVMAEQDAIRMLGSDADGLRYRLVSVVTHQGTDAHSGHYVAHVRPDPELFPHARPFEEFTRFSDEQRHDLERAQTDPARSWVLFNDLKVAVARAPPLGLAYMYIYLRE
eukprot:gnl/Chilomastix_cuspidata/1775.p1 GENE.gnl/Chilomastix_cuspidata/1775~~gnl/Chilomastix_cuspidata/1775.p1  ORF type:complete len:736 (+),score=107.37 gnl/Chilomastix_cuspidata/1775:183-2390(+)